MMLLLVLSLLTSAGTLTFMWANGSKKRWSWLVSLGNQPLWLAIIWLTQAWGLIPLNLAMIVLAIRGWFKWKKKT
jgi:hypothetical protein